MSETQRQNFYGDGPLTVFEAFAKLAALTNSDECAGLLLQACNEVEAACSGCAFAAMPGWVC